MQILQGLEWAVFGLTSVVMAQLLLTAYYRPYTPVREALTNKGTLTVGIAGAAGAAAAFAAKTYFSKAE